MFFDQHEHYYNTTNAYPQKITKTVIENRAPTDESVKIMKEMEEKMQSKILDRLHVSCNILEDLDVFVTYESWSFSHVYLLKFTVNKKRI